MARDTSARDIAIVVSTDDLIGFEVIRDKYGRGKEVKIKSAPPESFSSSGSRALLCLAAKAAKFTREYPEVTEQYKQYAIHLDKDSPSKTYGKYKGKYWTAIGFLYGKK